jgi:hypothetical protein
MTGSPDVRFQCSGAHCADIEALVRRSAATMRIRAHTCSDRIESQWQGTVASPAYGVARAFTVTMPPLGATGTWKDPLTFDLKSPVGSTSVTGTIARSGARTVLFHAHEDGTLSTPPNEVHVVEEITWTATIRPKAC